MGTNFIVIPEENAYNGPFFWDNLDLMDILDERIERLGDDDDANYDDENENDEIYEENYNFLWSLCHETENQICPLTDIYNFIEIYTINIENIQNKDTNDNPFNDNDIKNSTILYRFIELVVEINDFYGNYYDAFDNETYHISNKRIFTQIFLDEFKAFVYNKMI